MNDRWKKAEIAHRLGQSPVVALLGARQVGKTTLARSCSLPGKQAHYLDLESPEDRRKIEDPLAYFRLHQNELLVLDEIQRMPELFEILRGVVDANRQQHPYGQFLVLGSASSALQQQSESLAGRISYVEMGGFNAIEVPPSQKLWLRGGFPNSYLARNDDMAMDWLEDLIRTYLERDIPQLGERVSTTRLRRLWTMLAHRQGEPINISERARDLEMPQKEINRYLDILADLFLIRQIQPYHANIGKRLVKSPRYYIRDTGIAHRLLGIDNVEALLSSPVFGKSWEAYVIENIISVLPRRADIYYYRTSAGAEIDLVIKFNEQDIWAIEIKYGRAPKPNKSFSKTCDDVGAARKYIVYGGDTEIPIGDTTMLSLPQIMQAVLEQ